MVEEKRKPPKLGPSKASSSTPSQSRKPSLAPRQPSAVSIKSSSTAAKSGTGEPKRKPPKLGPRAGQPPDSEQKKPSATPDTRKKPAASGALSEDAKSVSNLPASRRTSLAPSQGSRPAPPKLAPRKSSSVAPKTAERPKTGPRNPSTASSQKTSISRKPSEAPKAPSRLRPKDEDDTPAHRLAEEERDLKSFLSEPQRADLTLLVADITKQMRKNVEKDFDASSGLKLIKDDDSNQDNFENLDFDPATVDVSRYDKERKLKAEQEKVLAMPQSKELKKAALKWFDDWREVVVLRVGEAVNSKETAAQQKGRAAPKATATKTRPVQKVDAEAKGEGNSGPKLEDLFPRIQTPLTKLSIAQRELVLHSILLLLLSLEHYNAASRVLLLYLTTSLKLGLNSLRSDEEKTAQGLLEAAKKMTAEVEAGKKSSESENSRKWKIRIATVAGAAVIGYTGGLAAPMIAAGVGSVMGDLGLGATAAAGYLGTVAGNAAVVGSLFGAYGGRMTGEVMSNISREVEDFAFLPIHGERKEHEDSLEAATNSRRLRVVVAISGWLLEKEEVVTPWKVLKPSAEVFALRFELEALMNLGQSFDTMLQSAAYGYAQQQLVKRTVFAELMSAMWPMALVKVARVVDNPFSLAKTRADKAGEVLAEALINRVQGERPVTLVGYSLGARVIWSCLTTLTKKKAFGLVESAVLMGSPIPSDISTWRSMRTAISGRLVNVYSENDYLLAFLYRTSSLQYGVAGLMPITGLAGIENVDVSGTVSGHLKYRYLVGSILQKIRFEDIDKDEVAKEAEAFKAIEEEEKKQTYVKQAGDLYENYGKKPKPGKSHPTKDKGKEVSDAEANREASAMEKLVQQKTQKGLMMWAAEQLYLSRPSADDAKKAANDPKAATKDATKTANKTSDAATKTLYQRAAEAVYLSRSGGPEGVDVAKEKTNQAQSAASNAASGSYLSTAAGYIPTGYLPSFSSVGGASKAGDKAKDATKGPRRPSTFAKSKTASKSSKSAQKKTEDAAPDPSNATSEAKDAATAGAKDPSKGSETVKDAGDKAKESAKGPTSYLPSFGYGISKKDAKSPETKQKRDGDESEDVKKAPEKSGNHDSYLPSFGYGSSKNSAKSPETKQKPGEDNSNDANKASEKSENAEVSQDKPSSSYTSYIPSFGFGGKGAAGKPPQTPHQPVANAKKGAENKQGKASKGGSAAGEMKDEAEGEDPFTSPPGSEAKRNKFADAAEKGERYESPGARKMRRDDESEEEAEEEKENEADEDGGDGQAQEGGEEDKGAEEGENEKAPETSGGEDTDSHPHDASQDASQDASFYDTAEEEGGGGHASEGSSTVTPEKFRSPQKHADDGGEEGEEHGDSTAAEDESDGYGGTVRGDGKGKGKEGEGYDADGGSGGVL